MVVVALLLLLTQDQEDVLNAAATNAQVEGAAATDPVLVTPTRNSSIVQNFQKSYGISGRQLAVTHAGMASMMAFQEMKAARELKTDVELALHRGSAVTGTTNTAPQLAGLLNKLTTNFTRSSGLTLKISRSVSPRVVRPVANWVNSKKASVIATC